MKTFLVSAMGLACFIMSSAFAQKTSNLPTNRPPPNIPMMDVGCPNGSFVQSINFDVRTQRGITLQCTNRIAASGAAPAAPSVSRCQPCVITPNGSKRLNNVLSNQASHCVYNDLQGTSCP